MSPCPESLRGNPTAVFHKENKEIYHALFLPFTCAINNMTAVNLLLFKAYLTLSPVQGTQNANKITTGRGEGGKKPNPKQF